MKHFPRDIHWLCLAGALCLASCKSAPPLPEGAPAEAAAQSPAAKTAAETSESAEQPRTPVIVRGTGALTGVPSREPGLRAAGADGVQLNFVDTDIVAILGAVLGDALNVPYIVDPRITGTMTLQASRPLSREDVLAALESALRVQGAALVNLAGVYHVVPAAEAVRQIGNLRLAERRGPGFGVYIVPLQYVGAEEMEKTLQPFAPDGGIVRVDQTRNLLLLAGTNEEIGSLLEVIKVFDVDWLAGMSFALYPLEYVDAKTIASDLAEVFAQGSPIAGVVRFVPITHLNSLLVVTPQAKYLQDIDSWIKRLDLGGTSPGRRIYVYDVQNGKADDLATSLNRILSLDKGGGGSAGGGTGGGTGTTGDSFQREMNAGFSQSSSGGQGGAGFPVRGGGTIGGAAGAVGEVAGVGGAPAAGAAGSGIEALLNSSALRIVPSAENNSLLVLASPSEFALVESALRRLDVLPIQILIEASIAEVTLTNDLRFGLQWAYQNGDRTVTLSGQANGAVTSEFPGFSYLLVRSDIRAVLNAIESITDVHVLSSPKLMVLNNREARLQIGDEVPIVTKSAVATTDSTAPIVNSVEFRDTGVILHVTPRANKSGRLILEITQEVSDVTPTTTSGIDSPTIQQRKISSTVSVRDGETIALGGLIRESTTKGKAGVPFLRRIPGLGSLFGSTDNTTRRTELVVLLTPHVIRSEQESEGAMQELREQFKALHDVAPEWQGRGAPPPVAK